MIKNKIKQDIKKICWGLWQYGGEIVVERPKNNQFGDFATNVALKVSNGESSRESKEINDKAVFNQSSMEIANVLADSLKNLPYIEKLEAVSPGFVNIFVKDSFWQDKVKEVLDLKDRFGSNDLGKGKKARVEFVSANPTGPLHFGNARGGPIGDVIGNVLKFSGFSVLKEYYHNDVGGQVDKLGQTILNVIDGQDLALQEYKGEYILDLAEEIKKMDFWKKAKRHPESSAALVGSRAVEIILKWILGDLHDMGIYYDKDPYAESYFKAKGETGDVINFLKGKGVVKEKDKALWFAPNDEFLKDRETVVIKSDGSYTYFANDIAYHRLKFSEGYDLVIDVMGANHHGHVPRLNAAVSALGFDVSHFKVILYQWVRFRHHGKPVSMSKRSGNFVTVREVMDLIGGPDPLRFMLLMYDNNSPVDFDIDLAREKSSKNPVYYVQYAYARICSILAKTNDERLKTKANYGLLTTNYELDLIKHVCQFPEIVEEISKSLEVHHLTKYATGLADAFHKFYENCQVIGEDKELSAARLGLTEAVKISLGNTLKLLGVSAPEKM